MKSGWKKSPIYRDFISKKSPILPINRRFFSIHLRLLRACLHSPMFRRFFGSPPIFLRYIGDFTDFWPIFPSIDNRCRLSFRCHPITDISSKYRRHFPIFQSMLTPLSRNNIWSKRESLVNFTSYLIINLLF